MSTHDEFWRTRLEAKEAFKKFRVTPDDPKLMQAYAEAWRKHQEANLVQFLEECAEP